MLSAFFAANINVDSKTGRVHVFCNDQVSFLLRNADKFIRPLQAKGIKVAMTILGNHDEAGMGNLSEAAAKDFAKELKAYLDIYGLDGIDLMMSTPATTTPIPAPASKHAHVPTSRVWFMSAARYLEIN